MVSAFRHGNLYETVPCLSSIYVTTSSCILTNTWLLGNRCKSTRCIQCLGSAITSIQFHQLNLCNRRISSGVFSFLQYHVSRWAGYNSNGSLGRPIPLQCDSHADKQRRWKQSFISGSVYCSATNEWYLADNVYTKPIFANKR